MRRVVTMLGCAVLLLPLLPTPAVSQEMERGDLGMVMMVEIAPADREAYESAVETLNDAAEAAGLTDYEWHFWRTDTGYVLFYPIPAFAYFDDPMQLWRAFEGTEGQAGRDEFFAAMQSIPQRSKTEIVESIPSLTYWPEEYTDVQANHVHHEWLAPGATEEMWMENARAWIAFLERIDYPYGVQAYRTRIGDERMTWVFFAPSLSDFYSDAAWDDLVEAAGAGAEMEALVDEWEQLVERMEHSSSGYAESMSYDPDDM